MKTENTDKDKRAISFAILAAALYAVSTPASKKLLQNVQPSMMAAFLYLGAGIGMSALNLFGRNLHFAQKEENLSLHDWPYVLSMIVLDIAAPLLMMFGLSHTTASSASLLNNFEIVATSLIASMLFHERVNRQLWVAILLVFTASVLLTFNGDQTSLKFSWGAVLVIGATICWGLENNCTRQIADKNPCQIVIFKGFGSGLASLAIAFISGEALPSLPTIAAICTLGFVSYGLSIYFYTYSQRTIGAAQTSTYYACAPFIGVLLSILLLGESLTLVFCIAFILMAVGMLLAARAEVNKK